MADREFELEVVEALARIEAHQEAAAALAERTTLRLDNMEGWLVGDEDASGIRERLAVLEERTGPTVKQAVGLGAVAVALLGVLQAGVTLFL